MRRWTREEGEGLKRGGRDEKEELQVRININGKKGRNKQEETQALRRDRQHKET